MSEETDFSLYETETPGGDSYPVIPHEDWRALNSDALVQALAAYLRDRFPYKSYTMSLDDAMRSFSSLSRYQAAWRIQPFLVANMPNHNVQTLRFDGQPLLLEIAADDYSRYDRWPERFTDRDRMRVRRYDATESPIENWTRDPAPAIREAAKVAFAAPHPAQRNMDAYQLREAVYRLGAEATEFKTTVAVSLYERLGGRRVLDISAGRGIRLYAAMARNLEWYVACDPDTDLEPCHTAIMTACSPLSTTKTQIVYAPFESVDTTLFDCQEFDLIFTSPPYFTLEIYSQAATQSTAKFPELQGWLDGFMFPSLAKAWAMLRPGGHLALNINDMRAAPGQNAVRYVDAIIAYASALPGARYRGVIGYANAMRAKRQMNRPQGRHEKKYPGQGGGLPAAQPIWVWVKQP